MNRKKSLLASIQALDSVEEVEHFPYATIPDGGLTLLPFICPFRYKPFMAVKNSQGIVTGVTTGYRDGITKGSQSKIDRVRTFWTGAATQLFVGSQIRFLMGDSDVYACCNIFPKAPVLPELDDFEVVSNKRVWEENDSVRELEALCTDLYDMYAAPIQEAIEQERSEHLQVDATMYHPNVPKEWKEQMIRRIISSYMLDGLLMRRGVYGPNPVILGVEARSTTVIQNAALGESEKIPIIMLKPESLT